MIEEENEISADVEFEVTNPSEIADNEEQMKLEFE